MPVKGAGIVVTSIIVISSIGWSNLISGLWHCWDGTAASVGQALKHPFNPRAEVFGFSDPRARSYLVHQLSPLGADPQAVIKQLAVEKEVSIRRALLLILGEFRPDQLLPADRKLLIPEIQKLYQNHPDPGLHGLYTALSQSPGGTNGFGAEHRNRQRRNQWRTPGRRRHVVPNEGE